MSDGSAPTVAQVLALALDHQRRGRAAEAKGLYRRVLDVVPDHPDALHLLGVIECEGGELERGLERMEQAVRAAPQRAVPRFNLGRVLDRADRLEEAERAYRGALAARPDFAEAQANLGDVLRRLGRVADAAAAFHRSFLLRRRELPPDRSQPGARLATRSKLRHDREQLLHLRERGLLPEKARDLPEAYHALLERLGDGPGAEELELSDADLAALGGAYNRLLHLDAGARVPGPAVNPALDGAEVTRAYRARAPGITWIDELLTPEALSALRRYCLDSTFWFDGSYGGGYVGAYLEDGFDCPLLLQIADELTALLPELLAGRPLRQMWAYKYDSSLTGIGVHADSSEVNVNFWLTPDEANLDPERGGLVVTTAEAPQDWDHAAYNRASSRERILRYLAEQGAEEVVVPHRQNRAVIFDSDLFHWTDAFTFRPGYTNRRLNVTMLFGDRKG